ncbi:MAG: hypothetical protein V3T05_07035 [Myxococcota bacterium]
MTSTIIQKALTTAIEELHAERDRIAEAIADLEKAARGILKSGTTKAGRKKTKKRKVSKKTKKRKVSKKTAKETTQRKKPVWTKEMREAARLRGKKMQAARRKKAVKKTTKGKRKTSGWTEAMRREASIRAKKMHAARRDKAA